MAAISVNSSRSDEKEMTSIVKEARRILNKLSPVNFDKLGDQFMELKLHDRQDQISDVVKVVLEKALEEPNSSPAYAKMMTHVWLQYQQTAKTLQKEILGQCQKEFLTHRDEDEITQKVKEITAAQDGKEKRELEQQLEEFRKKKRLRGVGKVRFVGELFKRDMLAPKIMVECVQTLLDNGDEDSYECLCELLTSVGQVLDYFLSYQELRVRECKERGLPIPTFVPEANYMDRTFKKLKKLSKTNSKLSSRIRFALLDLVELRENKWMPRRDPNAGDTIDEVRQNAIRGEQNDKRQIRALPENNPSCLTNRRQSPLNQNKSSQRKKSEWAVQTKKPNRFALIKTSTEPSSSPLLAPPGVEGFGQSSFNRNTNILKLPPRFQQQQQPQQQSQGGLRNRFMPSLVTGGNRFGLLSQHSLESPNGEGLMGGGSSNLGHNSNNTGNVSPSARDVPTQPVGEDMHEKVKNIFQEYLLIQNSGDILFWIKEQFPGDKSLTVIDELSRLVVGLKTEHEEVGAGKLIRLLIKNNVVRRDQVLDVLVTRVMTQIPNIIMETPVWPWPWPHLIIFNLVTFLLAAFGEESSLDWLLELTITHPLNDSDLSETHSEIIRATLNLFRFKTNEEHVKSLWTNSKKKNAANFKVLLPWLDENDFCN